ncbi:MAG: ABC transporter permease [Promethearchaeota archaeon]
MENRKNYYASIKPVLFTIVFEVKKQKRKFYFFFGITILIAFLVGYVLMLIPNNLLPDSQLEFFISGLGNMFFITLLSACLFFSGIICSEFDKKTGSIIFPKINKYKLILGKYFGNLILVVAIITIYYLLLALLGFYYYGGPINTLLFSSYTIAILYVIALSSFVTFFSSFMRSVIVTIIVTFLILLLGFNLADGIVVLVFADKFEPLYSLQYLGKLVTGILNNPFPDPRYVEFTFGGEGGVFGGREFTIGSWITPSIVMGITLLLIYIIGFFILASILFKRRQL